MSTTRADVCVVKCCICLHLRSYLTQHILYLCVSLSRLRLASFDSHGKLICSRSTGYQLLTLEKDQEYVVMNLDSRLLAFPLYVCCNFVYTSPHLDHRTDASEQESCARSVSWWTVRQQTDTIPWVILQLRAHYWHRLDLQSSWPPAHQMPLLTWDMKPACFVTQCSV